MFSKLPRPHGVISEAQISSAIGHGGEPDFERLLWLFSYALTNSHALKLCQEIAKIIRTSHSSSSTDHLDYFFLYLLLESEVLLWPRGTAILESVDFFHKFCDSWSPSLLDVICLKYFWKEIFSYSDLDTRSLCKYTGEVLILMSFDGSRWRVRGNANKTINFSQ